MCNFSNIACIVFDFKSIPLFFGAVECVYETTTSMFLTLKVSPLIWEFVIREIFLSQASFLIQEIFLRPHKSLSEKESGEEGKKLIS